MKKYLPVVVMALSLFGANIASAIMIKTPKAAVFTDVGANSTYYDALLYLKDKGVISGYPDGSFKPDSKINRAEFTKIIVEATRTYQDEGLCMENYGKADGSYSNMFTDVITANNAWYLNSLCLAKDDGLINGYPDGSFKPEQDVNFAEASKIIFKAFQGQEAYVTPISGAPWYYTSIENLASQKAIPVTIISFDQKITRGEMAEIIFRLKTQNTNLPSQTFNRLQSAISGSSAVISPAGFTLNISNLAFTLPKGWSLAKALNIDSDGNLDGILQQVELKVPDSKYQVTIPMSVIKVKDESTLSKIGSATLLKTTASGVKIYDAACAPGIACYYLVYDSNNCPSTTDKTVVSCNSIVHNTYQVNFNEPNSNQPIPSSEDGVWFPDTTVTAKDTLDFVATVKK